MTLVSKTARIGLALMLVGGAATAQTVQDDSMPTTALNIPSNLQVFGKLDPNVRKPTAIVNSAVITGTDVDQRVALIIAANQLTTITPEDRERLRQQVLRGLVDETLQIQQAKTADITVTPEEINQSYAGVARNFNRNTADMQRYLRSVGSSDRSLKRQIEAEMAWSRYLRRRVEPTVNVGEEEAKAILDRLNASKGSEQYHLKEIYLSAGPDRAQETFAKARQMILEVQKGERPFEYFAQFSEATTRATGGDLGWLSEAQLQQLPDTLVTAGKSMRPGDIAGPIEVPGGFSVLYLVDKRTIGAPDSRNAKLTLKQLTVRFPANVTREGAAERVASFKAATQGIQGCGDVANVAAKINAEVVDNASVLVRELPPQLQEIMLALQVGQSTPPFGSAQDGIRSLVLCGRDDPQSAELPGLEQMRSQMEQQKVNLRASNMLRDLRRDAVVEYR